MTKDLEFVWKKPVIVFYRERQEKPERRAFTIVKARRLVVSRTEVDTKFRGEIKDFFPLMGDIDYISSEEGLSDKYVICWFEDEEDDFGKAWRRLMGVSFPNGITFVVDKDGKRTYNAIFKAETAKLKSGPMAKLKPSSLIIVIYDSQTGFTEKMAEVVAEGAGSVDGADVELIKIGTPFSISKLNSADAVILGSPVIYGSVTPMMKTFLESMKEQKELDKLNLSDKAGAAFGSFAFSGGWVIRGLSEEMEALGMKTAHSPR
jgi:flavodoxin